jgi:hypothetical protein
MTASDQKRLVRAVIDRFEDMAFGEDRTDFF